MTDDLSVVITVRDDATRLGAAINSVLRAERLLEVVVVDDGSRDASAAVAESFGAPVRVHRRPARGVTAALNFGIAAARGALLGFVDSDDVWLDLPVDPRRSILEAHPDCIALGQVTVVGARLGAASETGLLYSFGAALIPRAVIGAVGPLDERLGVGSDLAWFLAARDHGIEIRTVPQAVLCYQRRDGSLSTAQPGSGLLAGLHHAIERRRNNHASN
ncbi:MAG: glycosyltransferase family A protein [Solirubrobacteraceae bacterium]